RSRRQQQTAGCTKERPETPETVKRKAGRRMSHTTRLRLYALLGTPVTVTLLLVGAYFTVHRAPAARAVVRPVHYTITDLGSLGERRFSFAFGINHHGQVVGMSALPGLSTPEHAFLWQDGVMRDLGTLMLGGALTSTSRAIAINDKGQ